MPYTPHLSTLQQAFAQQPLSVFSVTRLVVEPNKPHRQPNMHAAFIFTLNGHGTLEAADWTGQLSPSAVLHLCAGGESLITTNDPDGCTCIAITYVSGHPKTSLLPPVFDLCWSYELTEPADTTARASSLEELGRSPDLESRLNQIIGATAFLKGLFENEMAASTAPEGLRRAKAYIETHYAEPITLEQLGTIAGLSPKRFSERFNLAFGTRPLAYLIGTRMDHATELLATDLLIKDIAHMVGYEDQFYFSRIYKKYRGISPEAARKELHESER